MTVVRSREDPQICHFPLMSVQDFNMNGCCRSGPAGAASGTTCRTSLNTRGQVVGIRNESTFRDRIATRSTLKRRMKRRALSLEFATKGGKPEVIEFDSDRSKSSRDETRERCSEQQTVSHDQFLLVLTKACSSNTKRRWALLI